MAILIGLSLAVYQEEVIRLTIGKKGPSLKPTRNLHKIKAHGVLIAAIQAVTADHVMT
jgi:hypothetical protein